MVKKKKEKVLAVTPFFLPHAFFPALFKSLAWAYGGITTVAVLYTPQLKSLI